MNQPAPQASWNGVRERLSRAAQAIACSEGNFEQREASAIKLRTRSLSRVLQQPAEQISLLELLTFRLGAECYAIETKYACEILPYPLITAVPGAPEFLLGVINLRGQIVAVFDLTLLFGLASRTGQHNSRLIVVGDTQPQFGFIADAVEQVNSLDASGLDLPAGPFGSIDREIVRGIFSNALTVLDGRTLLDDQRLVIEQREEGAAG